MLALRSHRNPPAPQSLVLEEAPRPRPGTGDVLLEVQAAGYTPGELDWPPTWTDRLGRDRLPIIPCREVCGTVAEVGWGAAGFDVGDKVFGLIDWYRDGAAASFVAVEARNLAHAPSAIEHPACAALPMAALSATQALFRHGRLKPGQSVLILGAAGSVGSAAVQLAKSAGAVVIGAGKPATSEYIMSLGADEFLAMASDERPARRSIDLVFDTIGEVAVESSWELISPGGRLVSISYPPTPPPDRDVTAAFFVVEADRHELAVIAERVDAGDLHVPPPAISSLDDARQTLLDKTTGRIRGKIVLVPGDTASATASCNSGTESRADDSNRLRTSAARQRAEAVVAIAPEPPRWKVHGSTGAAWAAPPGSRPEG